MTGRFRTIATGLAEIKAADPCSAITAHAIRQLIINGQIPSRRIGAKYLFDLDDLYSYLKKMGD